MSTPRHPAPKSSGTPIRLIVFFSMPLILLRRAPIRGLVRAGSPDRYALPDHALPVALRRRPPTSKQNRMLVRVPDEVDGHLEVAEIQRRAYAAGAPAILYENVKGSAFPCVSNLFGTMERARFLLRDGLDGAKAAVRYRAEPGKVLSDLRKRPSALLGAANAAIHSLPRRVGSAPSQAHPIALSDDAPHHLVAE